MDYPEFVWCLAVWREARGEPFHGKVGVANVIRNRAADAKNRWPKSEDLVALQPRQFSCFNMGDPNSVLFPRSNVKPEWDAWLECVNAVGEAKAGNDPTDGSNHYHAIPDGKPFPAWADPAKEVRKLGAHRFYRL